VALFYSLSLTGLGWQTGWTPWIHWLRGVAPPKRKFEPCGVYRMLRHPVYLSFLGLIWFTPTMTLDHAVLTAVWTTYIFYGSYLKDERLAFYLGDVYRHYQERVAGYPGVCWGPLGKRSLKLDRAVLCKSARCCTVARTV
jgi:methanethiol S-methyltransferase